MEPIITRTTERRMVELCGEMVEVEETVTMDYGKQGTTTVYIRDAVPSSPAALQSVLRARGYELRPE